MNKPVCVKPAFYAHLYYELKIIARRYGYNLLLDGSMNRDLDIYAVPFGSEIKSHSEMIKEFAAYIDGKIDEKYPLPTYHGVVYIINLNRTTIVKNNIKTDLQYYLDISVIESYKSIVKKQN